MHLLNNSYCNDNVASSQIFSTHFSTYREKHEYTLVKHVDEVNNKLYKKYFIFAFILCTTSMHLFLFCFEFTYERNGKCI